MIKKLNVITLLLSIIMLAACSNAATERLRDSVKEANASCPKQIAEGIAIVSIEYDDNVVTYNVMSTTPILSVQALKSQVAIVRPALLEAMVGSDDPNVQDELSLIREAKADFRVVITDHSGSMELVYTPEEL